MFFFFSRKGELCGAVVKHRVQHQDSGFDQSERQVYVLFVAKTTLYPHCLVLVLTLELCIIRIK